MNELKKKIEALLKEIETAETALKSAETDEDKGVLTESITEKSAEVEALQEKLEAEIEKAEKSNRLNNLLGRANDLNKTDISGKRLTDKVEKKVDAQPVDLAQKMCDHLAIAHKFLTADSRESARLSGQELDLVAPKSKGFNAGSNGVALPLSVSLKMFGIKWAQSVGFSGGEIAAAMKASVMVSSSDALGGFTVPEDFRSTLLQLPTEETHLFNRATVIPNDTGEITIPKAKQSDSDEYGGMAGAWISEGGTKNKTDTQFEQVKISAHEYAMYTQVSIRLLARSAIAMENWIVTRGREKCMDAMEEAFINGDGSGKPTGILQTAGIRTIARQTADEVCYKDLVNLKRALKPTHRRGGMFLLNDEVGGFMEGTLDSEGRPLFTPSVANGMYDRLINYPYSENTRNPDLGTSGDVFFIDPREYYVPMEQEVVAKRSDDYAIINNLATIVIFVVVGGELVQPRVCAELGDVHGS